KRVESSPRLTQRYLAYTPDWARHEDRELLIQFGVAGFVPLELAGLISGARCTVVPHEKTAAQLKPTKMGRPIMGDHVMTAAERKRRSRANSKTLPTQERINPGAVVPPSLRPAASGPISMEIGDDMGTLILQRIAELEAGNVAIRTLLSEVL